MTAARSAIPGLAFASPTMRKILEKLAELGEVKWIGPGHWLATCPCCLEPLGAEFIDAWNGASPDDAPEVTN